MASKVTRGIEVEEVIVVTGAGGGMGLASVLALPRTAHVVLVDLTEERLYRALHIAEEGGTSATALLCDVTSAPDVAQLVKTVTELGSLSSLVHTAGISPQMAGGRRVLEVDLVGTARVLEALGPLVGPGTSAICVGSIAGYAGTAEELDVLLDDPLAASFLDDVEAAVGAPLDGPTGYVLAKRGVMRLCERLASAWGARGGRLVSISPGLIDTEMGRLELEHEELMPAMIEATPLKRPGVSPLPGLPEDIAALVAFLCSDAASCISGCDIRIDGGLVGAGKHVGFGT
jgi:NAD(P)-dependent dehydrogenase (short-subunit alcohol dehydrogenase family)